MREIKFRAYDTLKKRMFEVYSLGKDFVTENTIDGVNEGENAFMGKDFEIILLMQFTGLKDKNGKDIYEGDILKTESEKHMVVSWNKRLASFCLDREGWAFTHWFGESCEPEQTEVIGNIHQNPELLK